MTREASSSKSTSRNGGIYRSGGVDLVTHKAAPRRANVRGHGNQEGDS